ncbi:MAG: hypothetical protein FWH50_02630 [Coriobacteriia bacterium]|nr:hypothetical protein [Coriobacteriia bacterium]
MGDQNPKKPIYKRWYTWVIGLVLLAGAGQIVEGTKPDNVNTSDQVAESLPIEDADDQDNSSGQMNNALPDNSSNTNDSASVNNDPLLSETEKPPTQYLSPDNSLSSDIIDPTIPDAPLDEQVTDQDQPVEIELVSSPGTVRPGQRATITVKGRPNTQYSITVMYKSGPSKAQGLETKTSDSSGRVSWTWLIGQNTSSGSFYATVSGDGQKLTIPFTVE